MMKTMIRTNCFRLVVVVLLVTGAGLSSGCVSALPSLSITMSSEKNCEPELIAAMQSAGYEIGYRFGLTLIFADKNFVEETRKTKKPRPRYTTAIKVEIAPRLDGMMDLMATSGVWLYPGGDFVSSAGAMPPESVRLALLKKLPGARQP